MRHLTAPAAILPGLSSHLLVVWASASTPQHAVLVQIVAPVAICMHFTGRRLQPKEYCAILGQLRELCPPIRDIHTL